MNPLGLNLTVVLFYFREIWIQANLSFRYRWMCLWFVFTFSVERDSEGGGDNDLFFRRFTWMAEGSVRHDPRIGWGVASSYTQTVCLFWVRYLASWIYVWVPRCCRYAFGLFAFSLVIQVIAVFSADLSTQAKNKPTAASIALMVRCVLWIRRQVSVVGRPTLDFDDE